MLEGAENTRAPCRSESTADERGSARRCIFSSHRPLDIDCGKFIRVSEGRLRNRSSKASRSARVSHSARARHGTPVRELDLPVARSHVGTERLPRSTHRTRWPSPSPPTSPRRRRLPPGDASRPSAASPRAQPRVSRCPISTRRFVSRFVAPSRIEPVESRRGVPWRRRDGTDRTPPSGLKWIGAIARLMSICALADASPPPSPADRAHCRPRARQDRRG